MNWLIKTLASAMVAGIGWKIGVDAYETVKERLKEHAAKSDGAEEEGEAAENGAAATQTEVVEVGELDPEQPSGVGVFRW